MQKITEHFSREEFDCKDGTQYPQEWIDTKLTPLCNALEIIRSELGGSSVKIHSGYRTEKHNKSVGGAPSSKHCVGIACDFSINGISTKKILSTILKLILDKKIPDGGVGYYKNWIHYDQRQGRARWNG